MTKELIFNNWNFVRFLRLILGIFIAISAYKDQSIIFGLFSALLLFQAVTNTGCCGVNGCEIPKAKNTESSENVTFEEITKTNK